jgi:hypothetical protein
MENSLDDVTEVLGNDKSLELDRYLSLFSNAMKNAEYLFGKYAFRKIMLAHLSPNAHKQLINKALFTSWAVLLSKYEPNLIKISNKSGAFAPVLAEEIQNDRQLYNYLSFGTNGKVNMQKAFSVAEKIILNHLKV